LASGREATQALVMFASHSSNVFVVSKENRVLAMLIARITIWHYYLARVPLLNLDGYYYLKLL